MKTLQFFTDENLEQNNKLTPTQIAQFLEDFRQSHTEIEDKKIAISIRMEQSLLENFKKKCKEDGIKNYQKKIRQLMKEYL